MSAGRLLLPPHCTTPDAVITNKNKKFISFKGKENIQKKGRRWAIPRIMFHFYGLNFEKVGSIFGFGLSWRTCVRPFKIVQKLGL